MPDPVRYSPSVETVADDEDRTIAELDKTLRHIADVTFSHGGRGLRSVHAKAHGLLKGELETFSNLPSELAQGLFSEPGRYSALIRLSTIPGDLLDDAVTVPRAAAIKVVGVKGARLPGSEDEDCQDFVMADSPSFAAPTSKAFLANLKLLAVTTDRVPRFKKVLSAVLRRIESAIESIGVHSALLRTLGGHPHDHILGATFYTQAPLRYGDYIAKLALRPACPDLIALQGKLVDHQDDPNALRGEVQKFFSLHGATWELCVQLCTDLDSMPIENASVQWSEKRSPYVPVGRLTVAVQDSWSGETAREVDECMSFGPWHGLLAHQPLGSVMRARKLPYLNSAKIRGQRNGCPVHARSRSQP